MGRCSFSRRACNSRSCRRRRAGVSTSYCGSGSRRRPHWKRSLAMARVAVIGLGKVGVPLASYLTTLSHQVVGVDVDAGLVERLRQGKNPLPWEPAMNLQAFEATLSLSEALE